MGIEDDMHFFDEQSSLNHRIYTTGIGGKRTKYLDGSYDKSDKLFKSNERS